MLIDVLLTVCQRLLLISPGESFVRSSSSGDPLPPAPFPGNLKNKRLPRPGPQDSDPAPTVIRLNPSENLLKWCLLRAVTCKSLSEISIFLSEHLIFKCIFHPFLMGILGMRKLLSLGPFHLFPNCFSGNAILPDFTIFACFKHPFSVAPE